MLTAFDVGVGVLVLISAILATARGLTREVLSLATWAGSAAIAIYMWQYHPEIARQYIAENAIVADIATVVVTFIVALIVLHLLTMRIADFVVDSRVGPIDRTLGFVFGVLRGILIAIVITIFGTWLLPNNLPPWAAESQSLPHLQNMGKTLISHAAGRPGTAGHRHSQGRHGPDRRRSGRAGRAGRRRHRCDRGRHASTAGHRRAARGARDADLIITW